MKELLISEPSAAEEFTNGEHPLLIFFDGECVFCNQWVNHLLQADAAANRLRYGSKQGPTFQRVTAKFPEMAQIDSVVVIHREMDDQERPLVRSRAVGAIIKGMPEFSFLRFLLWITPTFLADIGYRIFSKVRYPLYGRMDACHVPRPEERPRFVE